MNTIFESDDYQKFKIINGNRTVVKNKVERIIKDVKNGLNLFPYCPIIVSKNNDDTFNIIDGQHRYRAAMELGHKISYIIANDIKLRDIARMNSNTDKWSNRDFLDCYIKLKQDDYGVLKKFMLKYKLNFAPALGLLYSGKALGHGSVTDKFKDGLFVVRELEKATAIMDLTLELFENYKFSRDRNLIEAVGRLMEKNLWDLGQMKQKIKSHPHMMDQCGNVKNYILLIEQIYNMSAKQRKIIY